MCLSQLSLGIVYVTLFVMPVSLDEIHCAVYQLCVSVVFTEFAHKGMGQIPFLGSVTEMSSVTLQKDVSLASPRLAGL